MPLVATTEGAIVIRIIRHLSDRLASRDLAKAYVSVR
jgi:hypothetical protein